MTEGVEYKVGAANLPLFPSPCFKEWDAALEEAMLQSDEEQSVIAIWENNAIQGTSVVVCLVFLGKMWVVWEGVQAQ